MIIRARTDRQGRLRLSEALAGEHSTISHGGTPVVERLMCMLGLIDGVEIFIETRGRCGDLIIAAEGERFHIPLHHAEHIWVRPRVG
jgi:Fe2+ transport system protein FeoA